MDKNENLSEYNINNNMDNTLLTVKEAANLIDETPNVVRNWMADLKQFIPLKKNEAGYNLFDEEAIEVLKEIKQLHRQQNYSIKQINHYFSTGGEAYHLIPEKKAEEILTEEMQEMRKQIEELQENSKKQAEFNEQLVKRLDKQQEYIKNSLEERDKNLLETMDEIKKSKQEPQEEEKQKKGFFSWLFGK